jgi:hypothetical protein
VAAEGSLTEGGMEVVAFVGPDSSEAVWFSLVSLCETLKMLVGMVGESWKWLGVSEGEEDGRGMTTSSASGRGKGKGMAGNKARVVYEELSMLIGCT